MFKEFKEFAMRGNVLDMAIGVIIGGAFGKIVSSFVADMLMPVIGLLLGKVDFSNLFIVLSLHPQKFNTLKEAQAAGAITLNYGQFIGAIFDFSIIAMALFLLVKMVNKMKKPVTAEATTKPCPYCFMDIPLKAIRCPYCIEDLENK